MLKRTFVAAKRFLFGPPEPVRLYGSPQSPPVRSVLMVARAIDMPLQFHLVNILKGEHTIKDFLKMNPQHTVPTLKDNNFVIWDSHAINTYLVNKYGTSSDLYPEDEELRARIDQRLHFDSGVLYNRLRNALVPIIYYGKPVVSQTSIDSIYESYDFLESFLCGKEWLAGDHMTLADLSCVATASTMVELVPAPEDRFPYLNAWLDRCRTLPFYHDANQRGLNQMKDVLKHKMQIMNV